MKYFKAKMGISIVAWSVAIGSFTQPNKQRSCVHGLKVPINLCRITMDCVHVASIDCQWRY